MNLVFLPGLLCDERLFAPQIEWFCSEYENVSVYVAEYQSANSLQRMAEQVLDEVQGELLLVGLSMGAMVALEIMRTDAHRVQGIVLLDTNIHVNNAQQIAQRTGWLERIQCEGQAAILEFTEQMFPLYCHHHTQELRKNLVSMAKSFTSIQACAQLQALNTRKDLTDIVSSIQIPTLVMCGRQDQLCTVQMHEAIYQRISGQYSTLISIDDCGHISTLEQPEQVNLGLQKWVSHSLAQPV